MKPVPIPPEVRQAVFDLLAAGQAEQAKSNRLLRRLCAVATVSGCLIGVGGVVAAASLFPLKQNVPLWMTVSEITGVAGRAVGTEDAPKLFGDATRRHYLKQLVNACESYGPDTVDITFHRCAAMLSQNEQASYADRVGEKSPSAPRNVLGRKGIARVETAMRFDQQAGRSSKPGLYFYTVRFIRSEFVSGALTKREPWAADVAFEFRPQAAMDVNDLTDNPVGMLVVSYSAGPDVTGGPK